MYEDINIEEQILGNILLKPDLMLRTVISSDCFLNPKNKFIYELFLRQFQDCKTIDIVTLAENYKTLFNDKYRSKEIVQNMTHMLSNALPISDYDYFQETLFSRFIRFKILESINLYRTEKITTDELLSNIHKYENMSIKTNDNKLSAEEIFELINSKNKNINFRLKKLSVSSNIQEHDLVVLAARPGIGKTSFILNLIEDLSSTYNCILFNMEMGENQVYQRLVSINTNVPISDLTAPKTNYQLNTIKKGCKNISDKRFKVINNSQTINSIRRKIINESKNGHVLVFIDYIGLVNAVNKHNNSYEKVTEIVRELRRISLDYDCTIFLVSQLNRNSENRGKNDSMPKLIDLKESGELEQSATTVLLLYDENYDKNKSKNEIDMKVIIAKNRNGKVGIVPITYNKEKQRYDEQKDIIKDPNYWRKETL